MKYELVIFDCDGVLVDSEPIYNDVLSQMLNEIGLPFTPEETTKTFAGRTDAGVRAIVEERLGKPLNPDFFEENSRRVFELFQRDLEPVPGIFNVLDALTVPTCVASSGPHERMNVTLGKTGLLSRFDGRIFSATEVQNGKPAPDVFLHAASRMGVMPGNCAVVEDTVVGVRAGVAAGMSVFGFATHADPKVMSDAGAKVFTDMNQLLGLLEE